MRIAEHEGYLLEVRAPLYGDMTWGAWVSKDGSVLGYAGGMSRTEAIDAALRTWNTARKPIERALREKAIDTDPAANQMAY